MTDFDKRKLQVFVSSTYEDLKDERQAAVEAILAAGHIPAGMELFAAGDKSQMRIIERWIDESDVYLLILGARYGSIEPESGKSYTHLEYEYASKHKKALFACVIDDGEQKIRIKNGLVKEDHPDKLRDFKRLVCSDKIVKFWKNFGDIKYAINHSLTMDFSKRDNLIGWLRSDDKVENNSEIKQALEQKKKLVEQLKAKLFRLETYKQSYSKSQEEEFEFEVVKVDAEGKIYERKKHKNKQYVENINDINLEMLYIPAGEFMMGSNEHESEQPIHKVTIKQPFYMGKYPITQAQWQAVMGNNPSDFRGNNRPVERVSWKDAVKFCEKISLLTKQIYRLPSEAEWEYACRAGTTTPFYFGETITTDLANYCGNGTYDSGGLKINIVKKQPK
ncbi:SUMF1/EgtB/PvdO family nonheme iron enzyme [Candidatus Halobeggiatoa sp. HSG11]|nr:SUMF1/EgtB/PvdO family nonheme iron enzyme [Candidatus Halobeggiatoa sp. HSG11]